MKGLIPRLDCPRGGCAPARSQWTMARTRNGLRFRCPKCGRYCQLADFDPVPVVLEALEWVLRKHVDEANGYRRPLRESA